jgi:hypothetical protein
MRYRASALMTPAIVVSVLALLGACASLGWSATRRRSLFVAGAEGEIVRARPRRRGKEWVDAWRRRRFTGYV